MKPSPRDPRRMLGRWRVIFRTLRACVVGVTVGLAVFGAALSASAAAAAPERPDLAAPRAAAPAAPQPTPEPTPTPTPGATPVPGTTTGPVLPYPTVPPGSPNAPVTPAVSFNPLDWLGGLFGSGGLLDIPGAILNAITGLLGKLVEEAAQPLLDLLGQSLLATPDVAANQSIRNAWAVSLSIVAGVYVLFIVAGGALVMGYETVQTQHAAKQIVPRLVVAFIVAAMSLQVMHVGIELANAIAQRILGQGIDGKGVVQQLAVALIRGATGAGLFFLIMIVVALVVLVAVLLGFMIRTALVLTLAACAPLALACHALPATDGLARLWWRAFGGCLVIQVAQSTVLIIGLRTFYGSNDNVFGFATSDGLGSVLAGICLFYILLKIPGWATRIIFQSVPRNRTLLGSLVRYAIYRQVFHHARNALRQRSSGGGRPGPRGGPGGRGGRGGGGPAGGPGRGGRPGGGRGGAPPRRGRNAGGRVAPANPVPALPPAGRGQQPPATSWV